MNKLKAAVLGSGPAGLLAATALRQRGMKPDVVSVKSKSKTGGAMYLHHPIPEVTQHHPEGEVTYRVLGDAETYARKVYGSAEAASIASFAHHEDGETHPAWNLVTLYDRLWEEWEPSIIDQQVMPAILNDMFDRYDIIVSSIPADKLCVNPAMHSFSMQDVWIHLGNVSDVPDGTIIYNGTDDATWYRQSNLWGWKGTEWGAGIAKPPLSNMLKISKPVSTNCDCWMEARGFIRVGRYGRWDKNVLTHHAYMETDRTVNSLLSAIANEGESF